MAEQSRIRNIMGAAAGAVGHRLVTPERAQNALGKFETLHSFFSPLRHIEPVTTGIGFGVIALNMQADPTHAIGAGIVATGVDLLVHKWDARQSPDKPEREKRREPGVGRVMEVGARSVVGLSKPFARVVGSGVAVDAVVSHLGVPPGGITQFLEGAIVVGASSGIGRRLYNAHNNLMAHVNAQPQP